MMVDPFLIAEVARANYFRGEKDSKKRPRKIRAYEKGVLFCVAMNAACDVDLRSSLKQSSFKERCVGDGSYRYVEKSKEAMLVDILSRAERSTMLQIARQSSFSYRRVRTIIANLQEIGVLSEGDLKIDITKLSRSA